MSNLDKDLQPNEVIESETSHFENLSALNGAEEVYLRCPDCLKLYVVETRSFRSRRPHFDCQICGCLFELSEELQKEQLHSAELLPTQRLDENKKAPEQDCPKCGFSNPATSEECYSCQIIFKKWNVPVTKDENAQPPATADIQWAQLVEKFDDLSAHYHFLQFCFESGQLDFATSKYKEMNTLSGGDPLCQGMLLKIGNLRLEKKRDIKQQIKNFQWSRLLYWVVLATGGGCFIYGLLHPGSKNLAGLGVAILFLCYGLTMTVHKNGFSWKDFLDPKS